MDSRRKSTRVPRFSREHREPTHGGVALLYSLSYDRSASKGNATMQLTVLKSKISYAVLTHTELFYEGSITIDSDIMTEANIIPFERVQVVNLSNGERIETYVIPGDPGSKTFGLNGPAARLGYIGDFIHILCYGQIDDRESFTPTQITMKDRA